MLILSDEIHADLVFAPNKHIPIAKLDPSMTDNIITCMSPTKTFNLAGLQVSYAIVNDKQKREALEKTFHKQGLHILNTMGGITALEAAYLEGKDWLVKLMEQLEENMNYVINQFANRKDVNVFKAEGTYLLWFDFRALNLSQEQLKIFLEKEAKVGLNDGASFGEEGTGFMRMNIACPLELVKDGTNRIISALDRRDSNK
ncbi:cystathionine beta-lyase [Gracilibacillus boraciitolerans JCM 21714]|uniref:cysteine-S-conjugate beta-lyase n=1 Tax=Gracilibacillus boraciitolerans JCM 21714 TaxID=1298598 RepID=W4VMN6_9BACI|nr:cystathionine beta-lyase [Gracilibacillus boraciitolerans JCM 21714]